MLSGLRRPPEHSRRCAACGAAKPPLVCAAADAAQMYENLNAAGVMDVLEALQRAAQRKGYAGMA
eukprot:1080407-Alexandrium_andersonii.AAC.1